MSVIEREVVTTAPPREVTTSDVLHRAADLIEEFGWCKSVAARDSEGAKVSPLSNRAISFCLAGAITRAAADLGYEGSAGYPYDNELAPDYQLADKVWGGHCLDLATASWNFNDKAASKAEVVNALRSKAVA